MRELSSSGEFEEGGGAKRLRLSPSASLPPLSAPVDTFSPGLEAGVATSAAAAVAEEEEYDDDEFEEAGDEGTVDPNQLIGVAGKMVPFSEVTEDMTGEMSADEYSVRIVFFPFPFLSEWFCTFPALPVVLTTDTIGSF